ncbi:hypothetical protein RHSIM_Rhsim12G0089800 [Rhododendron simsii]|uniref:Uncharacterized protein n=1 Tax=Rhododendron simsii TaxID=118357 RepID=A0A834G0T5_RHOSS|nr:hypothetical protein RHSIM_Rhsim12G0089800 [Rhododendron simsii]
MDMMEKLSARLPSASDEDISAGRGEEWTVGKTALEEGTIGDDLWACENVEELGEALTAARLDKGKRKVETDLTNLYDDYVELWDEAYP